MNKKVFKNVVGLLSRKRILLGQVFRFIVVGVLTMGINLSVVYILFGLGQQHYQVAASIGYTITAFCHFWLNRIYTFKASGQNVGINGFCYLVTLGVNYLVSISVIVFCVEIIMLSPYLGTLISPIGTAISGFILMKFVVFKDRRNPEKALRRNGFFL